MTVRNIPTSELAPRAEVAAVDMGETPFTSDKAGERDSSADRRCNAEERADDNKDENEEGPDELQVAIVADLPEREAAIGRVFVETPCRGNRALGITLVVPLAAGRGDRY
jgi:hypothetical protein